MIQRSNADTAATMSLPPRQDFLLFLERSEWLTEEIRHIAESGEDALVKTMRLRQASNEGSAYLREGEAKLASDTIDVETCPKLRFIKRFVKVRTQHVAIF
jgi:hypothetical protein